MATYNISILKPLTNGQTWEVNFDVDADTYDEAHKMASDQAEWVFYQSGLKPMEAFDPSKIK